MLSATLSGLCCGRAASVGVLVRGRVSALFGWVDSRKRSQDPRAGGGTTLGSHPERAGMPQMNGGWPWKKGTSLTQVITRDGPSSCDIRACESDNGCRDAVGRSRALAWPRRSSSSPSPSWSDGVEWESGGMVVESLLTTFLLAVVGAREPKFRSRQR
jgi:hypothetical protein